ncbi:MAG: nucleoside triphosphate pyrophosphohydrolase [Spirochaetaceae bacterium]|jgi:tetrapyrrole methylase family protein/MazG family protein|nr:nucleoside triphosphate pyrophosphohydrolase [Spirochaetaceae bacterium]
MNTENSIKDSGKQAGDSFLRLYGIIKRLRAPDGCPWDREQTPESLRGNLIEETYECIEAISQGDLPHIKEELGDVFLQAVLLSYMFEESGGFSVSDVLDGLSDKLVRRHPHVFGDVKVKNSEDVLVNWQKIKVEQEGRRPKDFVLDEVSKSLPPLDRACKLQKKAAKSGLTRDDAAQTLNNITDQLALIKSFLETQDSRGSKDQEAALGSLLFSAVDLCRLCKTDPSTALAVTNSVWEEEKRAGSKE